MSTYNDDLIKLVVSKPIVTHMVIGMEECSELIKALSKIYRYNTTKENIDNLIEEMADVYIVLGILQKVFCISNKRFTSEVKKKMDRNIHRL